jgi:hypothetical protein
MENTDQTMDIRVIGQRLHIAETTIGLGRRALHDLLRQEPVDEPAVELARQAIANARTERNALRRDLELARPPQLYAGSSWLK